MVGPTARKRAGQKAVQLVAQKVVTMVAPTAARMVNLLVDPLAVHWAERTDRRLAALWAGSWVDM